MNENNSKQKLYIADVPRNMTLLNLTSIVILQIFINSDFKIQKYDDSNAQETHHNIFQLNM